MGLGVIEYIPHERPGETTTGGPQNRSEKCYVCHGTGYFPTGDFVFSEEPSFTSPISEILDSQPEWVKDAVLRRPKE